VFLSVVILRNRRISGDLSLTLKMTGRIAGMTALSSLIYDDYIIYLTKYIVNSERRKLTKLYISMLNMTNIVKMKIIKYDLKIVTKCVINVTKY
jgi:hypothetical protein